MMRICCPSLYLDKAFNDDSKVRVWASKTSNHNTRLYFTLADIKDYDAASMCTKIQEFESIQSTESWSVGDGEGSFHSDVQSWGRFSLNRKVLCNDANCLKQWITVLHIFECCFS